MPCLHPEGLIQDALGQQRRKRQSDKGRKINRAEGRGGIKARQSRNITLPCLLGPRCFSQGCLLHFSTVPPYLLLKQSDESFMHRKLKNTVEEYMDERKQQEQNEGEREGGVRDGER